jgi:hypothetical protein
VLWVFAFGLLGFAVSGVLTTALELSRDWFVGLYLALITPVVVVYLRTIDIDLRELVLRHWVRGVAGAAILGVVMVVGVQGMDASPRAAGPGLVWDILWLGLVYGLLDALLLNVLPVMAVWRASTELGRTTSWRGKAVTGIIALGASLYVTTAYHLGFAEFRGTDLREPLVGNTLMTLGYILSTNPITAFVGHVALHVASVFHGVDATMTLPPHY